MAYTAFSVVHGEQPTAAKWNTLGTNDAGFNDGTLLPTAGSDQATVATSQTTTSTSYTDLATAGPAVTVTVGATGKVLVGIYGHLSNNTTAAGSFMSYAITGATTSAAADSRALFYPSSVGAAALFFGASFLEEGFTPGSTTFTAKYKVNSNTGTFTDRMIWAIPL